MRSLIGSSNAREQVFNLGSCARRQSGGGFSLSITRKNSATHKHIFPDGETVVGLLLVSNQRKMSVKEVMGCIAFSTFREAHGVDEHVGETIAGHGAVRATFCFKVQKQSTVPA